MSHYLNSPALTGVPTAPTASVDTNTTQIATTAFVKSQSIKSPLRWFYENAPTTADKQPAYRIDSDSILRAVRHNSQTAGTGTIQIKRNGTVIATITCAAGNSGWVDDSTGLSLALATGDSITATVSSGGTALATTIQLDIDQSL
jgi:hypothetical protein